MDHERLFRWTIAGRFSATNGAVDASSGESDASDGCAARKTTERPATEQRPTFEHNQMPNTKPELRVAFIGATQRCQVAP